MVVREEGRDKNAWYGFTHPDMSLSLSHCDTHIHVLTYCVHSLLGAHQIIAEEEM